MLELGGKKVDERLWQFFDGIVIQFFFLSNLTANGQVDSDDEVNVDDTFPANGYQEQLQALYSSSRGETTATTSVTSRHRPPASTPHYSRYIEISGLFHRRQNMVKYISPKSKIGVSSRT